MKKLKIFLTITLSSFLLFSIAYNHFIEGKILDDFTFKIKGTSNVHDWESSVKDISGTGTFSISEDGTVRVDKCLVSIPVKSIKSTKGSIMDKKTWKALDKENHPTISYELTSFNQVRKSGNSFWANTRGRLTIAGVTKTISMEVSGKELRNDAIEIIGSKNMKMSTFGISPPKALMGALTTGDDITVEFRITLSAY